MSDWDVIIIGAGIAGASAAYEIAANRRVLLLDKESQPGYHATGRSGAVFIEPYGNEVVQALTAAGKDFFFNPPAGFSDSPLLSDRELFVVGTAEQADIIEGAFEMVRHVSPDIRLVDGAALETRVPNLRKGVVAKALHDPGVKDMDVDALLQGFLRGAKQRGAEIATGAEVVGLTPRNGGWRVETSAGTHEAETLVNAAGAWVEEIAALAGAPRRGLTPMRRSLFVVDGPPGVALRDWPLVADIGEQWYFKPESGRVLASPSEEDAMAPCDARPDDVDIAVGVDRLQRVLDLEVRHIVQKWAGLRTFAADRSPVVGFDPEVAGFFWLAGQGGFGIQTAPAMGRLAAALLAGEDVPADMRDRGLTKADVSPARLTP